MSQVEAATNDDVWPELKHDNLAHRGKSNGERERERWYMEVSILLIDVWTFWCGFKPFKCKKHKRTKFGSLMENKNINPLTVNTFIF